MLQPEGTTMKEARKFTIVVRGNSEQAYEAALSEALKRIEDGNLSGADSADDGAFYFDSTDDIPSGELPR